MTDLEGFNCGHCLAFVSIDAPICANCHAEVVYGSSAEERLRDLKLGFALPFVALLVAATKLPGTLNETVGTNILPFFGNPFACFAIPALLALPLSLMFVWAMDSYRKKKEGVRFFRTRLA
jgi:hypothetical protein